MNQNSYLGDDSATVYCVDNKRIAGCDTPQLDAAMIQGTDSVKDAISPERRQMTERPKPPSYTYNNCVKSDNIQSECELNYFIPRSLNA